MIEIRNMVEIRDNIEWPALVGLYDYWDSRRAGRRMPARRDLDPVDVPRLLSNLCLLDVEPCPQRFRVRLYGSNLAQIRGLDLTGRYLDGQRLSLVHCQTYPTYGLIVAGRAPHYLTGIYPAGTARQGRYFRLALPLSDDDDRVNMILVGFYRRVEPV